MKALTTSSDVLFYTGLPKDFPPFDMRGIYTTEFEFFSNELGLVLYKRFREAKVDYTDVEEWSAVTAYTVGNLAKDKGIIYVCLENNTNKRPPNDKWELAPIFSDDCLQDIWCNGFLNEVIAWAHYCKKLPFIANQVHAEGIGTANDKFARASNQGVVMTKNAAVGMYETAKNNFFNYCKEVNKCLNLYQEKEPCCDKDPCGCSAYSNKGVVDNYDDYRVA